MIIEKNQTIKTNDIAPTYYYDRARESMKDLLKLLILKKGLELLFVPAYIGVSPKEGSGIYDPLQELKELGLETVFYRVGADLSVDFQNVCSLTENTEDKRFAVLKVNYFGFADIRSQDLYHYVKRNGGLLIEDNAHSFFTHFRKSTRECDAAFFSLHKQFPFSKGGMLRIYDDSLNSIEFSGRTRPEDTENPWIYDIQSISEARRRNYQYLQNELSAQTDLFDIVKSLDDDVTVPQTFPLLLKDMDRYSVYLRMNQNGYGVTSLYHTLIPPLRSGAFPVSEKVSSRILNLPVHQDVDTAYYKDMLSIFVGICQEEKRKGKIRP